MENNYKLFINSRQSCYVIIDYYNNQNPIGKIINTESIGHDFYSLASLLNLMSEMIENYEDDSRCFISDKNEKCSWSNDSYQFDLSALEKHRCIASFKITVLFTQRYSWQGIIKWLETDEELCFRSVYELINIIDNVCSSNKKVNNHVI